MKFYNIKQAQKEALNQINTTFKLSEIGYGKGFYEGQMQERKYWQDKIKAKIEEYEKMKEATKMDTTYYGEKRRSVIEGLIVELQSLLEKE